MASSPGYSHEPIAIVGMGCRWPGNVRDASGFWEYLRDKVDGWKEFGAPRFSKAGFYHPDSDRPGSMSMQGAFLLEEDARLFDHTFFGMTALEVQTLDPSQRKLLEVVYEAIENAGDTWSSVSGSRTGVFVGNFCLDHWMIQSRDWDYPRPYAFTGAGTSILANRISYIFNLQGPSLTVDTACSSSMYALHLAMNALRAGDCDSAIVASANWVADPGVQIALDKLGALSATSRCHTFDDRAGGYARGEGYGAIYLKRIPVAAAHESPIRAVIRGTAINSNGRTGGITRPSANGQELVIREAYKNAGGLPYSDTSFFECHGTGTYVGDPIEVAAVGRVFGPGRDTRDPLLVGSVKSNLGHGEGASALASIMKVVLALEKGFIPPIYDLKTRNPNIDFEGAKIEPVTELTPWPEGKIRRASINSFGYGGANGHCILDHVNNVLPGYVAPGVYGISTKSTFDYDGSDNSDISGIATNGHTNTRINGYANGHVNGHKDVRINGHSSGLNGCTNCYIDGYINGCTNGYTNSHTNGHINGQTNGHTNGHTNGFANGVKAIANHRPIGDRTQTVCAPGSPTRQWVILPFSAHNEASYKTNIAALAKVCQMHPLADIAYTVGMRRSKLTQRSFCVVEHNNIVDGLVMNPPLVRAPLQTANLGFVFTGQGAQWQGMAAQLLEYKVFRSVIEYLDDVLGTLPNSPSWSLLDILASKDVDSTSFHTAEISQTICTAVQIGLVDLLASWSVRPSGVVGHSSGEIAAAYASGRITAAGAIISAYLRGQAVSMNKRKGAMLAVGLGSHQVFRYLEGREGEVQIAAINSPDIVTLSGEATAIHEISTCMTADNVFNRILKTGDRAYHSHHMIPIGSTYADMLDEGFRHIQELGLAAPEHRYRHVPWISSVTPEKRTDDFVHPASYWRANLQSPVRFSDALTGLMNDEVAAITAVIEIGPHPALKGPTDKTLKASGKSVPYISTLKRGEDARISMLQCAGTLFTLNASVDFAVVNATDSEKGPQRGSTCLELPPYQYTYGDLNYHENRASKEYRHRSVLRHDLLGSKVVGTAKLRPQWRNLLRLKDVSWLTDHRLTPDAVLPGAAYVSMAVEASSRIHSDFFPSQRVKGFSLEDVAIKKTLVIPEDDHGVEMLTTLDLSDSNSGAASAWATFTISSVGRDTGEWTEHSTGAIKIEIDAAYVSNEQLQMIPHESQAVDMKAWYRKFSDIGLDYGPTFQTLSKAHADPRSNTALATVDLCPDGDQTVSSRYAVHPASLDGIIQLGLIACNGGRTSEANTAFVPVHLANLYVSAEITQNACDAVVHGERRGLRGAHLDLQMLGSQGELLLRAEGLRCVSYALDSKAVDLTFASPFSRLVWKPDIRFMTGRQACQLYPPPHENIAKATQWRVTNKIAHFVVFSIYAKMKRLDNAPEPLGELGHFFDWIKRTACNDRSELMEEARNLAEHGNLVNRLDELASQAPDVMEVKIMKLLHEKVDDILYERRTGMEVIIQEGLLTPLYQSGLLMTGIYPQLSRILGAVAHSNPNLRIIEIGGGTGGATRIAMKAFTHSNGIKLFNDYTFTDISAGFLSKARESVAELGDMNFSVLDVEVDPSEQGFEQAYDLVLACQVLHATSDMHRTLTHCRKLLRPGGKLIMVETTQNFIVPGMVVGTFTGYWAGIPDGRVDAPFQSLSAWNDALQKAGFSGVDISLDDFPEPNNTTSVIVSTVLPEGTINSSEAKVDIFCNSSEPPTLVASICQELEKRHIEARLVSSADQLDNESRVIALYDDDHLMIGADEEDLTDFQRVTKTASSLVAVTSSGTVKGRNAGGAVVTGLLRVLHNENPANQYTSIDVDAVNFRLEAAEIQELARAVTEIESKLHRDSLFEVEEGNLIDREFSWQDGCMWVSRYVPDSGFHSQHGLDIRRTKPERLPLGSQGALKATFETPGLVNSLYFSPSNDLLRPLPKNYIDVKIRAWGVNAQDFENWTGRSDGDHLSSEYSGVVTAVGDAVGGFQVGDYVYGLGKGQFGTHARVPVAFASKLESGDDLVQMASLPLAYTTAVYALEHVGRVRKGQSVLVQAGASDVAIAIITLARSKQADVFAIADTPEQAEFLVEKLALPALHVISTSDLGRLLRIAKTTRKQKFETYISTSPKSEILSKVLAPLGQVIELGGKGSLRSLKTLVHMATYSSIDVLAILETDPVLAAELTQSVNSYRQQGLAVSIPGLSRVDVENFSPASLDLVNLSGKLVVDFGRPESLVRQTLAPPTAVFDSGACYIVTGGLGGVGQTIVSWMADRGVRNFALLSRRTASDVPEAEEFLSSLASRGIEVQCLVCDVSKREQVSSAVERIAGIRPVRGIVHAAVSYLDLSFEKTSAQRWQAGLSAKVRGTQNLHDATLSMPLDFFVMPTSALSLYAFATQGAYTAANNFQDAFARYRRNLGLPASTVAFSLIREATNVGTDALTVNLFERNKAMSLSQRQFLDLLEPAFLGNRTTTQGASVPWTGESEDPLSSANLHTYLDPQVLAATESSLGGPQSQAAAPMWHRDARASHMVRALHDLQQQSSRSHPGSGAEEGSQNTPMAVRAAVDAAVRCGRDAHGAAVALAQESIVRAVAAILYVDVQDIDVAKSVADLGVDSLIAAELRSWFLQALNANISMLDLLDPAVSISSRACAVIDKAFDAQKA